MDPPQNIGDASASASAATGGSEVTSVSLVDAYNRCLVELILQCKAAGAADGAAAPLKKALRAAGHSAIDPTSADHLRHAATTLPLRVLVDEELQQDPSALIRDARVADAFEPLSGVPFSLFAASGLDAGELARHLLVLATLCATACARPATDDDALPSLVLKLLPVAAGGKAAADPDMALVLDDDISTLLLKVDETARLLSASEDQASTSQTSTTPPEMEGLWKALEGSKIASLATEITSELDISELLAGAAGAKAAGAGAGSGADPSAGALPAGFGLDALADPNSMLGAVVSKVGSKIQSKLASGELDKGELLGEVAGVFKALDLQGDGANGLQAMLGKVMAATAGAGGGGADGLAGLLSKLAGGAAATGAGGGSGGSNNSDDDRRERLQRKLREASRARAKRSS